MTTPHATRRPLRATIALLTATATALGALIALAPAAGADPDTVSCTGAVVVVPGTVDPEALEMARAWDRHDDYEVIAVKYPTTLWPMGMIGYDEDVRLGVAATTAAVQQYRAECPDAPVEIVGWSQGARIAGDVLSDIGTGRITAIDPAGVSGVLYSDPRMTGTVAGRGIELSLIGLLPGLTMSGARDGGFGVLAGEVVSVCVERDGICDLPDPLHDPIGVLDGLIGYGTRHFLYPDVMDQPVLSAALGGTDTWLDEVECTDQGTYGTICHRRQDSAASGVVRDAVSAIGLRGDRLPDLLVLRPRIPASILPGVDLAAVQSPIAFLLGLLPELPNLTYFSGGHLPDLFAFTDTIEGVFTLDREKFERGTGAIGDSIWSILSIPRNSARHTAGHIREAMERHAAQAAATDSAADPVDTEAGEPLTGTGDEQADSIPSVSSITTTRIPAEPDRIQHETADRAFEDTGADTDSSGPNTPVTTLPVPVDTETAASAPTLESDTQPTPIAGPATEPVDDTESVAPLPDPADELVIMPIEKDAA